MRRFWYHYNKPASNKAGCPILTVHWKNECIPVKGIRCEVETETHNRNSQPHCVVRGFAENVIIKDSIAYVG